LVIDHGEELQIIHYKALGDGNRKQGIGSRDGILIVGLKPTLKNMFFKVQSTTKNHVPIPIPRF
jgi:hypothetical protein